MTTGVYLIRQISRDRAIYIGSSIQLSQRIRKHISRLNRNAHPNQKLQNTWNKYGAEDFEFSILEECVPGDRIAREEFWMRSTPAWPTCNMTAVATAHGCSDETRLKLSEALRGRKISSPSEEHRRKISESLRGLEFSEERRHKISEGLRGKKRQPLSEEHRRKLGESHRGRKLNAEHRRKLSESHRGQKLSEEHRRKIGEGHRGLKRKKRS